MSKQRLRISNEAVLDLENIWIYTKNKWSITQANKYYRSIIREIEFVADNYEMGKSIEETRESYRVFPVQSHLIFYRKVDDGVIEIVRILHQRMNLKKWLK